MGIHKFIIVVFVCFTLSVNAQVGLTLIDSLEIEGDDFFVDKLGQIYSVTDDGYVKKYDTNQQLVFEYSDKTLGELSSFDIFDPFNILAFYEDYQLIRILDRTLNPFIDLELLDLDILNISACAMGQNGFIWMYDDQYTQLLKVNQAGEVISRSQPLSQVLGWIPSVDQLVFAQNSLWLRDQKKGIIHFDWNGQYVGYDAVDNVNQLLVINSNQLLIQQGEEWKFYNLRSKALLPFSNINLTSSKIRLVSNTIYVLETNQLKSYRIEE
ncbi:MAG: hypothetical protein AAFO07_19690 [Bacteroidota bacterium]